MKKKSTPVIQPVYVANRMVAVVLPKAPFAEWIAAVEPDSEIAITLEVAREDSPALLIPTDGAEDEEVPGKRWIEQNWRSLFEQMLSGWYVDPAVWPRNRTLKMFHDWCDIRIHSIVMDCDDTPLECYAHD